jgi:hypothetical protein
MMVAQQWIEVQFDHLCKFQNMQHAASSKGKGLVEDKISPL